MSKSCSLRTIVCLSLVFVFAWAIQGTMIAQEEKKELMLSKPQTLDVKDMQVMEKEGMPGFQPLTKATALQELMIREEIKPVEVIKGDHVANGIGLRNRGGGVINLRGIPMDSTLVKSYLYWCILGNTPVANPTIAINGVTLNGSLVGIGDNPCWTVSKNYVYRAQVPNYLLYNAGNGDYEISGVPSSQGFGMNTWDNYSGTYLAEGATLIIFYRSATAYNYVSYIYDKPISGSMFYSSFGANLGGFTANKPYAKFTMIGADGQLGNGVWASYSCSTEHSFFQGRQIAGYSNTPTSLQDADSDWNGHDGEPLNQLWDTRTHMVQINLNSTSALVKYKSNGDCLVVCAFILSI